MKICFLMLSHWSGTLGGAELQVRYLMDYIRTNTTHELSMICRHARMDSEDGVPILRARSWRPLGRYFKAADYFSVRALLERLQPDVVYTRTSSPYVGFAAAYCRKHGKKLVYHIAHVEDVTPFVAKTRRQLAKKLERPIYEYGLRHAQVVIAQAQYQVDLLRQHYRRGCAGVIENFHPVPPDEPKTFDEKIVLWVASIKPRKRPELFINLARRLAALSGVRFVMIGEIQNPQYSQLAQQVADTANLTFLGKVPVEEVNRLMQAAHLFVNTSEAAGEGFPNTFIQSWLRRVPVASLEVDPDGLLAIHNLGRCFDGDFERMVAGVSDLLRSDATLQEMGATARSFAIEHYGTENCRQVLRLIEG